MCEQKQKTGCKIQSFTGFAPCFTIILYVMDYVQRVFGFALHIGEVFVARLMIGGYQHERIKTRCLQWLFRQSL